jgi:hypothetical protein
MAGQALVFQKNGCTTARLFDFRKHCFENNYYKLPHFLSFVPLFIAQFIA